MSERKFGGKKDGLVVKQNGEQNGECPIVIVILGGGCSRYAYRCRFLQVLVGWGYRRHKGCGDACVLLGAKALR